MKHDAAAPPAHAPTLVELAAALSLAALAATAWVALTAATGKTYHFAPIAVAAAPAVVLRLEDRRLARGRAALLAAAGGLTAAVAWIVIVVSGVEPSATLIADQPGGVTSEVTAGALAGAIGTYLALRR